MEAADRQPSWPVDVGPLASRQELLKPSNSGGSQTWRHERSRWQQLQRLSEINLGCSQRRGSARVLDLGAMLWFIAMLS